MATTSGGRTLNRECSCQFRAPMGCSYEQVRSAVAEQVGVSNVRGFQAYGRGRYQIFLKNKEIAASVAESGLKLQNEKVTVDQISGGTIVLWVKLAPFELDNAPIAAALSRYGFVKKIEDVYSEMDPRSWLTGERRVVFQPREAVPNFVKVGAYTLMITYKGQTKTCRICDEVGHFAAECPNKRTCTYCKKEGHMEEECWARAADDAALEESQKKKSNDNTEDAMEENHKENETEEPIEEEEVVRESLNARTKEGKNEDKKPEREEENNADRSFVEAPEEIREIVEHLSQEEETIEDASEEVLVIETRVKTGTGEAVRPTGTTAKPKQEDSSGTTRGRHQGIPQQVSGPSRVNRQPADCNFDYTEEGFVSSVEDFPTLPSNNVVPRKVRSTSKTGKKKRKNKNSPERQEKKAHVSSDEDCDMDN